MAVANTQIRNTVSSTQTESMGEALNQRQTIMVLVGVLLGMLLAALDQTIVGTAMPRIISELNGLEHYTWVFTAYLLASTVTVPIYGKLSDIYGRKLFFTGGMAVFLFGSALSGMSQDMTQLIVFRTLQGLGAGAIIPIAMAIIGDIFPPAERGKWQGLTVSIFGLSTIIGPTIGGWITDHWGWRWVFYINMPLGALAILAAAWTLPKHSRHRQHVIDYLGAVVLVLASVPLLLAFSWAGNEYAWDSPQIIGLLVFAVVMCVAFLWIEQRAAEPIINPSLFKNSIFSVSIVAMFLASAGMFGATLFLPLFAQAVMQISATNSGVVSSPMMVGFMISSIVGGQIVARTGRYKVMAMSGFAVATFGMWTMTLMTKDTTTWIIARNMIITGLGIGATMSLFTIIVQNAFPFEQLGQVTASLQFFRSIGGVIGVAILGTIMTTLFKSGLQTNMPAALKAAVPAERLAALQNPQLLMSAEVVNRVQQSFVALGPQGKVLFDQLMEAIRLSLANAIVQLFFVGTGAMALAFVVTFFLKEIPLRRSHRMTTAEKAAADETVVEPI